MILVVPLQSTGETSFHFTSNSVVNRSLILVFIKHLLCMKLGVGHYFVRDLMIHGKSLCTFIVRRLDPITAELKEHTNYFISLKFC